MDATKKRAEKLQAEGKSRLQGTAPDGAGRRHDQHPERDEQTLDALARHRKPMRGAFNSFSAFNKAGGGDIWFALLLETIEQPAGRS